jgi:hypothetical protein
MEDNIMKITTRRTDLQVGTMLSDTNGIIKLTSDYDDFHGWYEYINLDIDDDGNLVEGSQGYATPTDLIGYEIW